MDSLGGWEEKCVWLAEHYPELSEQEQAFFLDQLEEEHARLLDLYTIQHDLLQSVREVICCSPENIYSFSQPTVPTEGLGFFQLEMYQHAVEKLVHEASGQGQRTRLLLYLGYACVYEEREAAAADAFLSVIKQSADRAEQHFAYTGMGLLRGREERMEEAIAYFEKALALINNPDVLYNLGTCYFYLEKYDLASASFQSFVHVEPDAEAYYWLGQSYYKSGMIPLAHEAWYQAVEQAPGRDVLLSLAAAFEEKGEFLCAFHCYQHLSQEDPEDVTVLHGMAWNLGLMDRRTEAVTLFRKITQLRPDNTNVWISYLWLLNKWSDSEEYERVAIQVETQKLTHPLLESLIRT
ncbi:tetratricopeptide repeat protein [Alteribacter natronophilus]|uniref:tetratricopeptide repeat protein n=1 Tax=Alteribacter natronophilus TaxID=2583810 RepID=UPI00110D9B5A|nr:tetratricopeptide repeat protein [Alteribacter natronophilus]TMW73566.1 tetratricopeptide repeat protein [Alteribacter natronophilus]